MENKSTAVKEAVRESLVGTKETSQLSSQTKSRFNANAAKDPETGELYLGPVEFINAVAPESEDYHKIKREQFAILFTVADRKGNGRVSLSDFMAFENLLMKPDAEYEIAFRLFDVGRTGTVKSEDFRKLYELNKGPDSLPFNWDCEWARLYTGGKNRVAEMSYPQFSQMLRGLQGERVRQAFLLFDKDSDGLINPEDFERIILETSKHKLSDHLLENLHTLCNISRGSKISYAQIRAFQNMIKEMDLVELIIRKACAKSKDGKITRAEFLQQAAKITRFSLFTPMEADILFHFASIDEPSGRLSLTDFSKVLDPTWRSAGEGDQVGSSSQTDARSSFARGILESTYNFALGSIAGAFGAFMVYPIDLVKTRLQNQRGARPGERLYKNSIDCFQKVVRNEGFRGLYSGVLPQLVGVAPEKAIKLTVNDLVRGFFTDKKTGNIFLPYEILAGGSAGACQVVFTNPLEIVKIRLQVQGEVAKTVQGAQKRSAMWIVRNLGLVGLYKGAPACLLRDVPFSAIYFPAYSHLKRDFFGESKTKKLGVLQLLTAGAIAGMPAAYLTTPFDVIKTRLQVEARKGETSYNGVAHAAKTIMKEEGFQAFWKGGPARIFRSSPQFGFTLAAYEVLKSVLPMPGSSGTDTAVKAAMATLREKERDTPFSRSRNALKIILDIDEDFGRPMLKNPALGAVFDRK